MLEQVCYHLNNWFIRDAAVFTNVTFAEDEVPGEIEDYVLSGGLYRVEGTYTNDGAYMRGEEEFNPETAKRVRVSLMAVPKAVRALVDEISEWEEKYGEVAKGPFFSESFGGYEYEIRGYSSYGAASSNMSGWRLAFANRLNPWRKM